jgi:hypothetical protein
MSLVGKIPKPVANSEASKIKKAFAGVIGILARIGGERKVHRDSMTPKELFDVRELQRRRNELNEFWALIPEKNPTKEQKALRAKMTKEQTALRAKISNVTKTKINMTKEGKEELRPFMQLSDEERVHLHRFLESNNAALPWTSAFIPASPSSQAASRVSNSRRK